MIVVDRPSPEKVKREVKIDIEDGGSESQRRISDKRKSTASHSTTGSKSQDNQEDELEVTPMVTVFGVVSLTKVRLLASVGELQLETEIKDLSLSASRKEEENRVKKEGTLISEVEWLRKIQNLTTAINLGTSRSG